MGNPLTFTYVFLFTFNSVFLFTIGCVFLFTISNQWHIFVLTIDIPYECPNVDSSNG